MGARDNLRFLSDTPARMIPARPACGASKMAVSGTTQNATRNEAVLANGSRVAVVGGGSASLLFAFLRKETAP
jgi:hypothetical protein